MRGAVHDKTRFHRVTGIIPARAGSSTDKSTQSVAFWDHPRACGEQLVLVSFFRNVLGSSPRVRGADDQNIRTAHCFGIIPARAGSSGSCTTAPARTRDHPRACGEQADPSAARGAVEGSSPRVRGAAWPLYCFQCINGIIPARAGSRRVCWSRCRRTRDHPRACGEQLTGEQALIVAAGSSPRVRGAVHRQAS